MLSLRERELLWSQRAIRERRGMGTGCSYIPWIQVRRFDLNSHGRSHVLWNPDIGRQHHLLSDLELNTIVVLLWYGVKDIREQFPLSLTRRELDFTTRQNASDGTVEIASRLGFKHPKIDKQTYRRLTTDFVINNLDGSLIALYVKYHKELSKGRERRLGQLLAVTKEYWRLRGVRQLEVTELDIDKDVISWALWCLDGMNQSVSSAMRRTFVNLILKSESDASMHTRLGAVSKFLRLGKEETVGILKHCLFRRDLLIDTAGSQDLNEPWRLEEPGLLNLSKLSNLAKEII